LCDSIGYIRVRQQLPVGKKLLKKKSRARRVADMLRKIESMHEIRKP